jgi:hypothetical protein
MMINKKFLTIILNLAYEICQINKLNLLARLMVCFYFLKVFQPFPKYLLFLDFGM